MSWKGMWGFVFKSLSGKMVFIATIGAIDDVDNFKDILSRYTKEDLSKISRKIIVLNYSSDGLVVDCNGVLVRDIPIFEKKQGFVGNMDNKYIRRYKPFIDEISVEGRNWINKLPDGFFLEDLKKGDQRSIEELRESKFRFYMTMQLKSFFSFLGHVSREYVSRYLNGDIKHFFYPECVLQYDLESMTCIFSEPIGDSVGTLDYGVWVINLITEKLEHWVNSDLEEDNNALIKKGDISLSKILKKSK